MGETLTVLLSRSVAGRGWAAYRGFDGAEWVFMEGKPARGVPAEFALALVSNNNEEWQTVEHDHFEIVPDEAPDGPDGGSD